jgi:drug/metabolite transporter (DMT)-like permease
MWAAVVSGFAGVVLVLRPGLTPFDVGYLGAIGAAVVLSVALVITRRLGPGETSTGPAFAVLVVQTLIAAAVAGAWAPVPLPDLALMGLAGLFVGCAHVCVVLAFRYAPAPVAAPLQFSQILWAVLYGVLLFGDVPDVFVIFGSLVVVGSGVYVFIHAGR